MLLIAGGLFLQSTQAKGQETQAIPTATASIPPLPLLEPLAKETPPTIVVGESRAQEAERLAREESERKAAEERRRLAEEEKRRKAALAAAQPAVKAQTVSGGPDIPSGTKRWADAPADWPSPVTFDYISPQYRGHFGIDYAADCGVPIQAPANGEIVEALRSGYNGGYGKTILVKHDNGIYTRYAHLSSLTRLSRGPVAKGEEIGKVGTTGRSTGCHLHYETYVIN